MSEFKAGGYVTGSDMVAVAHAGEWVMSHLGCPHYAFLDALNEDDEWR